jgi:hypothetical protein
LPAGPSQRQASIDSPDQHVGRTRSQFTLSDRVDDIDFDAQMRRAELQRELLGRRRLEIAAAALAS